MAAGLGFKEFAVGDILTAADANGYLASQTVMVFASSAARASAITSPQEGMISFLKDTDTMQFYTGAAWSNVDTGSSPLTTKGDLYAFSTINARLAVGTNGQVLTADSAEATGLKWATPAAAADNWTALSTTAFSASSNINVNSVFTSAYDNYKLIVTFTSASADGVVQLRLRASGTDSSTNYTNQKLSQSGSSVSGSSNPDSSTSFFWLCYATAPYGEIFSHVNLFRPFLAEPTMFENTAIHANDQNRITGKNTASTSYDGFSIIGTGGTLTGTVRVFGYKNS
jgi:hypothetical protein